MGNVLEFYLKMKDMMSSGLVKVAATAKSSFVQVEQAVKKVGDVGKSTFVKLTGETQKTQSSAVAYNKTLGSLYDKMKDLKNFRMDDALGGKAIKKATSDIKDLQKEINKLEGKNTGGGRSFLRKAAGIIAPLALAGSLMSFGKSSINAAMEFETQKTSFGVLTGNRGTGNDLTNNLRQLKQETIMGPAVYKNAQTMLGFGIASEKVIPNLKMLGDISMGDADKLGRLTLAFSQVSAAGRLTGQDLLQFINAGFNPLGEISKKTGKSFAALKDEMREGKITFAMVEDAFKTATSSGGRFNGMMETIAGTTMGKMKKMEGQWAAFKIDVGGALMPMASAFMDTGIELMKFLNIHKTVPNTLRTEQSEIATLVTRITSLNQGNKTRIDLLQQLKNKYPDLFGNLDVEKTKNEDLLRSLDKINTSYGNRIALASQALVLENSMKHAKDVGDRATAMEQASWLLNHGNRAEAEQVMREANGGYLLDKVTNRDESISSIYTDAENARRLTKAAKKYRGREDNWNAKSENDQGLLEAAKGREIMTNPESLALMTEAAKWVKNHPSTDNTKLLRGTEYLRVTGSATEKNYEDIRKMMGIKSVSPTKINPTADIDGDSKSKKSKASSDAIGSSITGGGPRVINIHGVKFADKIELHAASVTETAEELQKVFDDMFLRTLNSGASVQ